MKLLYFSSLSLLFLLISIALASPSMSSSSSTASETNSVLTTLPNEVEAMVSLKRSLAIPERLGWESDPCTPSSWEGVTCITNPIGEGFVIYEIDLADKGLKGYISGMITLLQNLNSLNLSSNCLIGEISSLVNTNLVKLDLSDNHLSGTIHSKISSARLELLNLSKNQFTGWFPNELYSILYRGGILDVSGNKGLCGVGIPSLPQCSPMKHRDGICLTSPVPAAFPGRGRRGDGVGTFPKRFRRGGDGRDFWGRLG